MGTRTIKEWLADDRPRERLERLGPAALSPRELLAILLETGAPAAGGRPSRSAVELAADVLDAFRGVDGRLSLRRLAQASLTELQRVPGVGLAKATKLLAALELGRRVAHEDFGPRWRIRGPRDVFEYFHLRLRDTPQEEFHVLLVNAQHEVLRDVVVSRGVLDAALVHPREVFRPAIVESAAAVVLAHNHPSGDPTPSTEDRQVTRQLVAAGRLVDIEVLDHVVVGDGRYVSFRERGWLDG
jgi:DNA repair protein RadC